LKRNKLKYAALLETHMFLAGVLLELQLIGSEDLP
jgi:hypothetical protein